MTGWTPVALRTGGVVLALLTVAVGCTFEGVPGVPPDPDPPPPPSELFAGCFKGEAVQPDSGGSVTLGLEPDRGPDPDAPLQFTLRGCMQVDVGTLIETVVLTGEVRESVPEEAQLAGTLSDGTPIAIEVVRSPPGDAPAESLAIRGTRDEFQVDQTEICESTIEQLGCPVMLAGGGGGGS